MSASASMAAPALAAHGDRLSARAAVLVFLAFALAYFFSALMRAVTATLSPTLSAEFNLTASDLGLLAGGYFFGFALTQLPMGTWLDRHGPRRVVLGFLTMAVLGCASFALAGSFAGLLASRVLVGMGVSACLMAPLTGFRRWLDPATQLRANSWMLMTGSLGMVASTLPVQWLLPHIGWRGLFWALAVATLLCMAVLALAAPAWRQPDPAPADGAATEVAPGYGIVWRHPYFQQLLPLGLVNYGGMIAVQTLWAGPWMIKVGGSTPAEAAAGLFGINLSMLATFWLWGLVSPHLARRQIRPEDLIAWGQPLSLGLLLAIVVMGGQAGWVMWALFCTTSTVVTLSQPAIGMALPPQAAGRGLSAFNLAIFLGVFLVQWAIGLLIDAFTLAGWPEPDRFRAAIAVFALACLLAYARFWRAWRRQAR
jgi:predicted MFS family arabinose efflux permease